LLLSRNKILTDISPSLDARLEGQRVGFLFWALPAVETARQRRFYVSEFQAGTEHDWTDQEDEAESRTHEPDEAGEG